MSRGATEPGLAEHKERFQAGAERVAVDDDGYIALYMPSGADAVVMAWRITHGIIVGSAACGVLARAQLGVSNLMLAMGGRVVLATTPDAEPDEAGDAAAACVTAAANRDYAGVASMTLASFSARGLAGLMAQLRATHEIYLRLGGGDGFPDLRGELNGL